MCHSSGWYVIYMHLNKTLTLLLEIQCKSTIYTVPFLLQCSQSNGGKLYTWWIQLSGDCAFVWNVTLSPLVKASVAFWWWIHLLTVILCKFFFSVTLNFACLFNITCYLLVVICLCSCLSLMLRFSLYFQPVPSVLWHCWLGSRKGMRPVKNWVVGCWRGYLSGARCRLAYGPADATATHCLLLQ